MDERIPKALRDLMEDKLVSEEEIQTVVAGKGYYPQTTPILNYDPDFISGVLVGAWPQVYEMIRKPVSYTHLRKDRCCQSRYGKKGSMIMNKQALFCDGTGVYVIPPEPVEDQKIILRFRTAKDDVQEAKVVDVYKRQEHDMTHRR